MTELRAIAKSLDLKIAGLKKSELVDAIATGSNGSNGVSAGGASAQQPSLETGPTEKRRETAPPLESAIEPIAKIEPSDDTAGPAAVPADGATDEHRQVDRQQQRRPQSRDNRSRPREKVDTREGRGRRRRRGRGSGSGSGAGGVPNYLRDESWEDLEAEEDSNAEVRMGILDLLPEGYGFLRTSGYLPGDRDVYVSASQVRRFHLRKGDEVTGSVRAPKDSEKYQALLRIRQINGGEPAAVQGRPRFADLTPLYPEVRLTLETDDNPRGITARIVDLVAPIGKGQRGMIVSPPKAGKTTIMKEIANAIRANNPEVHLIILLVDERPEEVTDMQRSVSGAEVIYSTFDRPSDDHIQVTELTLERAKR
ncbi:MAG: transcription termination factor Rho, partial [Actinobacteria bacterium]|nr:transcription termination factor Rho [Actinomycetota bacterium]